MNGRELIDAYLDDALTEAQQQQLDAWLAADAENVRTFVRETYSHCQLRDFAQVQAESKMPRHNITNRSKRRAVRGSFARTAAAIAAAVLVAFGVFWQLKPPGKTTVVVTVPVPSASMIGTVKEAAAGALIRRGGIEIEAANGTEIFSGDTAVAGSQAQMRVHFKAEETHLALFPHSEMKIAVTDEGKRLDLLKGKTEIVVAPQQAGRPLVAHAKHAVASVRGTRFKLASDEAHSTLEVAEGSVQWSKPDGSAVLVSAGFYSIAAPNLALQALPVQSIVKNNNPGAKKLRVVTYTLAHATTAATLDAALSVLRECDADVIALQKCTLGGSGDRLLDPLAFFAAELKMNRAWCPEYTTKLKGGVVLINETLKPGQAGSGQAILSRFPIREAASRKLTYNPPDEEVYKVQRHIMHAKLDLGGGRSLWVLNTILPQNNQERTVQCREVAEFALTLDGPRVITGCYNTHPSEPGYKFMADHFTDAWSAGEGNGYTNKSVKIRSEWIFFDPAHLKVQSARLAGAGLSNHFAISADLILLDK